jgi:L-iditol 2-dehydrogenase
MKVAMLEAAGRIVLQEANDLRPGPGELLIRTAFAGVCGSDLHTFQGAHPFRKPPVILGHEIAGTVAELGAGVSGFRPGDRVTVMPLLACGSCPPCRAGTPNICLHKTVPGVEGWLGTFAEYFLARPSVTYRLGKGTGLDLAVLAEPLAVGVHSVLRRGRVGAGSRVLVLGAGTIGILTACAARLAGAAAIAVTDVFPFNAMLAAELCGGRGYAARMEGLEDTILHDHPEKFDVAFLCSGAPATVATAFRLTRRGGRIVVTGLFHAPVPTDLTGIALNEFDLSGSVIYDAQDFQTAVEWIDGGRCQFQKVITHVFPLAQAQAALSLLAQHAEDVAKILLEV